MRSRKLGVVTVHNLLIPLHVHIMLDQMIPSPAVYCISSSAEIWPICAGPSVGNAVSLHLGFKHLPVGF